jgi:hypothetical protein
MKSKKDNLKLCFKNSNKNKIQTCLERKLKATSTDIGGFKLSVVFAQLILIKNEEEVEGKYFWNIINNHLNFLPRTIKPFKFLIAFSASATVAIVTKP